MILTEKFKNPWAEMHCLVLKILVLHASSDLQIL